MNVTVDTDNLQRPQLIAACLGKQGTPYIAGVRLVLDCLGIPLPHYMARKEPGVKRGDVPSRMTVWRDKKKAIAAGVN